MPEVLLDLLKGQGLHIPKSVDDAYQLSQYAVQTRYPGEWEPVGQREALEALEQAGLVLTWVENRIR